MRPARGWRGWAIGLAGTRRRAADSRSPSSRDAPRSATAVPNPGLFAHRLTNRAAPHSPALALCQAASDPRSAKPRRKRRSASASQPLTSRQVRPPRALCYCSVLLLCATCYVHVLRAAGFVSVRAGLRPKCTCWRCLKHKVRWATAVGPVVDRSSSRRGDDIGSGHVIAAARVRFWPFGYGPQPWTRSALAHAVRWTARVEVACTRRRARVAPVARPNLRNRPHHQRCGVGIDALGSPLRRAMTALEHALLFAPNNAGFHTPVRELPTRPIHPSAKPWVIRR